MTLKNNNCVEHEYSLFWTAMSLDRNSLGKIREHLYKVIKISLTPANKCVYTG